MKVTDKNGYTHNWPPTGHQVDFNDKRPRSELHLRCRKILRDLYPTQRVLEEIPLPGENLTVDFFLPLRQLVIEVQGEQHTKFIAHFHHTIAEFKRAQANDRRKEAWCDANNIEIVHLPYTEDDDEWQRRIEGGEEVTGGTEVEGT